MSSIEEQQKLLWLEEQLLEEVEKTERLKQMLGRADYLTGQLVFLLDSFDQRIANLSTTIAPIHDLTQRLTYRNQNIDQTVENLGKVIGYFNLPNDLKQTIRMGSIGEDLDGYLVKVDKLFEAVTFITKSRLKSGEKVVVQLRTLHTDATNRLETEFRSALEKVSQVFDILVFHNEEKNTKFEAPVINDEETLNNLKKLAKYLQEAPAFKEEASDFTEIFVDVRSNYLKKIFEPLARESSVVEKVKKKGKTSDIYEKGSHPYIFYMTSLLVMLQAEKKFNVELVSQSLTKTTFENTFLPSIDMFIEAGEAIVLKAKRKLVNNDFSDMFIIFDLLENLNSKFDEFELLTVFAGIPANEVVDLISSFKNLALTSFTSFLEDVQKSTKQSMLPQDGTVHELTSNTLNYLTRVCEYKESIESLLLQGVTFGGVGDNLTYLTSTGRYFVTVIDGLRSNLETKAKGYKRATLSMIFLLNNYHYILKTVLANPQLNELIGKEIEPKFKEMVALMSSDYLATWKKAIEYLLEVNAGRSTSTKIAPQKIKERFKGFNEEFDELYRTQQQYSIPDRDLRGKMRREIIDLVAPLYKKFLERYEGSNFTKHPEKYILYTSEKLESMMNQFFDVSS